MKILPENACLLFIDIHEKFSSVISGMNRCLCVLSVLCEE